MKFGVGEMVIMHSPHTGQDIPVQYRGKIGDDATVIMDGLQMTIPVSWLRKLKVRAGVTVRCYGSRTGTSEDGRCGWAGDSGVSTIAPNGEERCPRCGGSTIPPLRFELAAQNMPGAGHGCGITE